MGPQESPGASGAHGPQVGSLSPVLPPSQEPQVGPRAGGGGKLAGAGSLTCAPCGDPLPYPLPTSQDTHCLSVRL